MPRIRQATLYRQINRQPATVLRRDAFGKVRAALTHEMKVLLRDGFRIQHDANGKPLDRDLRFTVARGDTVIEVWIEAEAPTPRRKGAGRPPLADESMIERTVTLTPSQIDTLSDLGDGNVSAGIRRLLEGA